MKQIHKDFTLHPFLSICDLLVGWQQHFYFKRNFTFCKNFGSINEKLLYFSNRSNPQSLYWGAINLFLLKQKSEEEQNTPQ